MSGRSHQPAKQELIPVRSGTECSGQIRSRESCACTANCQPDMEVNQQSGPLQLPSQRLLGKLNTAPSRTPALGQRCVIVLRLV